MRSETITFKQYSMDLLSMPKH